MKKLSIIVPVYNVSPYLKKCLESLLYQDLSPSDYEIIIVNDGSTDDSLEIAKEFLEQNNYPSSVTIHLISQSNGGLSAARNTGIKQAVGKYIQFVDSDDFLEPNVLGVLLATMENEQLDVLRFNYQNVSEQYQIISPTKNPKQYVDYSQTLTNGKDFLANRLGYACYAWMFIFKTELICLNELYFMTGIYFEDVEWTPRVLAKADLIASTETVVYNYLLREGSITQSVGKEKHLKLLEDKFIIIDSLNLLLKDNIDSEEVVRWIRGMNSLLAISVLERSALFPKNDRIRYLCSLKSKSVFPLSAYHVSKKNRRAVYLINTSPYLFRLFELFKISFLKFKS